mgnify:CR=1 FL=1
MNSSRSSRFCGRLSDGFFDLGLSDGFDFVIVVIVNSVGLQSNLQELFARGAHYGYSRRRRHPSVNPYLYGFKNRTAIIDLEKSLLALAQAENFLKTLAQSGGPASPNLGGTVLWVGTKPEARESIAAAGPRLGLPYVITRWIGGTLTNFSEIKKRLARLKELKEQSVSKEFERYTKQERGLFHKERERLERAFSTISGLTELPRALVVVDSAAEKIAVAEARSLGLPIVALAGTDCDIRLIDYPIVVNDASVQSISWVVGRLVEAYEVGRAALIRDAESAAIPETVTVVNDKG